MLEAFKSESERRGYDITFINHNVGWSGMTYLEHWRYRNVDGVWHRLRGFLRAGGDGRWWRGISPA